MMNELRGQAKRRGLPDGLTLLIGLAALAGAGLALARQATYGALLNLDSVAYVAVARNLLAGEGLVGYGGDVYITWPPLYPLMLAGGSLGVADPLAVAGPLNAAIFGLTIFVVGRYLQRRLARGYPAAGACFALALALPLTGLAAAALSEPLFILLATLALMRTDDYLAEGKTAALLWAAILSALAWQTRYIGVVVPAFIGLAVVLQVGVPLGDRLRRGAMVGLIAGLPMAAWLGRNYLVTGSLTGHEAPVDYSLVGIALDSLGKFWGWAYYNPAWVRVDGLGFLPAASAGLLIAALGAIAVGCVWGRVSGGKRPARARRARWLFGGFAVAVAGVYLFSLYALGLPPHGVDGRFFAPMYAPLVVVAAVGADRLLAFLRDSGGVARQWVGVGLPVVMALWLVMQIVPNVRAVAYANSDEFEHVYTAQPWISSATLRYIREYPMDGAVFSNRPPVVYLYNRGDARYRAPDLSLYYYGQGQGQWADALALADWAAEAREGAWVVWFNEDDNFNVRDKHLPQLRAMARMMPVGEFADGAIFRVDDDYVPDAGSNPFMAAYEGIAAGDYGYAAAYSDFSVYWDDEGGRLLYLREPCGPRDIDARFLLHIYPSDAAVSRDGGRFVNADFDFAANGALFEGKCVGIAPLPDYGAYGIERIITGQYVSGATGAVWRVDVGPDSARGRRNYAEVYRAAAAGMYGAAAAQAEFAVYRAGDALVYIKDPCEPADVEARFFLHIIPADAADLPAARAESGFDNFDFWFAEEGAVFEGKCVGVMDLPGYGIVGARTGQFVSGSGVVWRVEFGIE